MFFWYNGSEYKQIFPDRNQNLSKALKDADKTVNSVTHGFIPVTVWYQEMKEGIKFSDLPKWERKLQDYLKNIAVALGFNTTLGSNHELVEPELVEPVDQINSSKTLAYLALSTFLGQCF